MRVTSVLLAVWATLAVTRAQAQRAGPEGDDARSLFEAGTVAYREARYEEALRSFERVYELAPRPEILFNIGLCHERLGDDAEAVAAFERYLTEAPNGDDRAEVDRRLEILRRRLAHRASAEAPEEATPPTPDQATSELASSHRATGDEAPRGAGPVPAVLLVAGAALAVGGGVTLAFGAVDRGAVTGAADGVMEWADAQARLDRGDALLVTGAVAAGLGLVTSVIGLVLLAEDDAAVEVRTAGSTLVVRGRL